MQNKIVSSESFSLQCFLSYLFIRALTCKKNIQHSPMTAKTYTLSFPDQFTHACSYPSMREVISSNVLSSTCRGELHSILISG